MFAKYDADGDRVLNAEEQKAMHDDLEEQRKNIDGEINQVSWLVMSLWSSFAMMSDTLSISKLEP